MNRFSQDSLKESYFHGQNRYNTVVYSYPMGKEIVKTTSYFYKNDSGVTERKFKLKKVNKAVVKNNGRHKNSLQRTKRNLRRLIFANPDLVRFATLTYATNMCDREQGFKDFKNFIKRLRYRYPNIKYIAVVEYQDRGAIHFHFLLNTYIPHKMLEKIWGHGWVFIELVRNRKKAINYLSKYMSEDFSNHESEKKLYTRSRNLDIAKKEYFDIWDLQRFLNRFNLRSIEIVEFNVEGVEGLEVVQVFCEY